MKVHLNRHLLHLSLLIVFCIFIVQYFLHYLFTGSLLLSSPSVNPHFSSNYVEARGKFRNVVSEYEAITIHDNLTMDIALFPGDPLNVLIHISGTHGVEGFAGSAIQHAILQKKYSKEHSYGPTVIFIHALNPYGFHHVSFFKFFRLFLNFFAIFK